MTGNAATSRLPDENLKPEYPAGVKALADHSRYVQRVRRRYADWLALLPVQPADKALDGAALQATHATLQAAGHDAGAALRILRQLALERLAVLDVEQGASLEVVCQSMTALAEFALETACTEGEAALNAAHGQPLSRQGLACKYWVLGMGKLGARELNVSSDIDPIFIYEADGETAGNAQGLGRISSHEYFTKLVRAISTLLADNTEHGFVFRVDWALRPNGNSGPPACSLDALEGYFQAHGREWERFAWLKSRVVAPYARIGDDSVMALRHLITPFVFRKYLDYNVFEALRVMHRQIREHAAKRSAGRPERSNDVKLSRGGIREIEFTVQLLQVVRGGQYPELRTRPTLKALERLSSAGLMPQETAKALAEAYVFLRRVEHRIQFLDDQQTHVLPTNDADLNWMASSLGFADAGAFLCQLDAHREVVAHEFDTLLGQPASGKECKACGCSKAGEPSQAQTFEALRARLPAALHGRFDLWCAQPRLQALAETTHARLLKLLTRSVAWLKLDSSKALTETDAQAVAFIRLLDWLEPLLRRESYLALLVERPAVQERLLRLLGAAKWPARYLLQHPGVIDELADPNMLTERFDAQAFEIELETRRKALRGTGDGDEESLLNLLRRAHHAEVFRTLTRDVEGVLTVEQVADDLSALADTVLRIALRWCWDGLRKKHREQPQIGIIGYGKLGGKELGYGSDLDIVFVYEDDHDDAPEIYALLVRKLINWLTVKTGEGDLYEIDTALRPNGNSGLLVTTFKAYADYQQQRGSNAAWTWEHQAMTRARFILSGDEDLTTPTLGTDVSSLPPEGAATALGRPGGSRESAMRERFEQVREAVICAPRDAKALKEEITAMRERVRKAHPAREGLFDVKQSAGGMMDVEFAVQYLVLMHSAEHKALRLDSGNIALLHAAEDAGLLPQGIGHAAADAYRELRRIQHQARLDEAPTQLPAQQAVTERSAVLALWHAVFD